MATVSTFSNRDSRGFMANERKRVGRPPDEDSDDKIVTPRRSGKSVVKRMMLAATILWIVAIPVVFLMFFAASVDGDASLRQALAGMVCALGILTTFYVVAMVLLGVVHFTLPK